MFGFRCLAFGFRRLAFGFRRLAFGGFQLLRSKIFGGFWGCGLLDFRGRWLLMVVVVVVVVGRFASGGLWEWVTVAVGSGCAAEIWWWIGFGGSR